MSITDQAIKKPTIKPTPIDKLAPTHKQAIYNQSSYDIVGFSSNHDK
jgi:hypothetical protein